jgi:uncharacterized protein YkwD
MPVPTLRRLLLLTSAALAVAAGLGSSSGAAGRGGCAAGPDWPAAKPALAAAVLDLVNAHRRTLGLGPLRISATLTAAAVWKARHMARYHYMSHDDPAPPVARSPFDRIRACGYSGAAMGENIAEGFPTPASVMQAWLNSPGHRANIEGRQYAAIGIGAAADGSGAVYWTQDFGSRVDAGAPAAAVVHPKGLLARRDRASTARGRAVVLWVLHNDRRPRTGTRIAGLSRQPRHGVASVDRGSITYQPRPGFVGRDRFRYVLVDSSGERSSALVVVRVRRR